MLGLTLHDIADALYRSGNLAEYDAFMRLAKLIPADVVAAWEGREEQRSAPR